MAKIVILGGGFGGLATAHALRPAVANGHTVTLVDRKEKFFMGLAKLWVLTGERPPHEGWGDRHALTRKGLRFTHADVIAIDGVAHVVRTSGGDMAYDMLVIAMGAETSPSMVPGLPEHANLFDVEKVPGLHDQLSQITAGHVAIVVCSSPYKCPPAPFEASMLVDMVMRRRGIRSAVHVTVYIPDPAPMPVAGPAAGQRARTLLAERGIVLETSFKIASVDPVARTLAFGNGEHRPYDILLAIPPHHAPHVVHAAGLTDASGWIPVDPATLAVLSGAEKRANMFAIGDVTAVKLPGAGMLPKAGIMAEQQGHVVAANILAVLNKTAPTKTFDGKGYCFFEVGEHKAMMVEGSFYAPPGDRVIISEPSADAYVMKEQFEKDRLALWFS